MKKFIALVALFASVNAFAFNDINCNARTASEDIDVRLDIDRFNRGETGRADIIIRRDGQVERKTEYVRRDRFARSFIIAYESIGRALELEIDVWPDRRIWPGKSYRATLSSDLIDGGRASAFCRFR